MIPDLPQGPENARIEKKMNRIAIVLSVAILLLVVMMRRIKFDLGVDFSFLAPFHASLNALTSIVLIFALYFILIGNIQMHRRCIYSAMLLSIMFLLSYVLYHFTTEETKYCGEGQIRYLYFFLLISHIVLAAGILPFIFFTFIRGYTGQYDRHRKMARWIWPLWFYVSITGPICYLMLAPCMKS